MQKLFMKELQRIFMRPVYIMMDYMSSLDREWQVWTMFYLLPILNGFNYCKIK